MTNRQLCPRCNGFLLRVSGRETVHHECLNCGYSDEPSPLNAIEARHEAEQARASEHAEAESPAGD